MGHNYYSHVPTKKKKNNLGPQYMYIFTTYGYVTGSQSKRVNGFKFSKQMYDKTRLGMFRLFDKLLRVYFWYCGL